MNTPRILIVDDEPSFVRLIKLVLEGGGRYSVRVENDGTKAVEVAREFQPNLVLLDLVMPKIDGLSVAQALRAEAQFSDLPVLFLSATVVGNDGFNARIAGFPAISKPVGVRELAQAIDRTLGDSQES